MADQILKLPTDSLNAGKNVDLSELTVGANVVERERGVTADPTDPLGLAKVKNAQPASTDYGLVVRPLLGSLLKRSVVITTTDIGASANFASAWFDSTLDGVTFVEVSSTSAGVAVVRIEQTDDPNNSALTSVVA